MRGWISGKLLGPPSRPRKNCCLTQQIGAEQRTPSITTRPVGNKREQGAILLIPTRGIRNYWQDPCRISCKGRAPIFEPENPAGPAVELRRLSVGSTGRVTPLYRPIVDDMIPVIYCCEMFAAYKMDGPQLSDLMKVFLGLST